MAGKVLGMDIFLWVFGLGVAFASLAWPEKYSNSHNVKNTILQLFMYLFSALFEVNGSRRGFTP
jgi:hypothetical protein